MKYTLLLLALIFFSVGCSPQIENNAENALQPEETSIPLATNAKPAAPEKQPVTLQPELLPTKEDDEMTPIEPPSVPYGAESLIEKAKLDLAERISIEVDQINLITAEDVVWSNSSLGCPQPDMFYAEVLTPGYRIILNANGVNYEYHTSKGSEVVYCTNPQPPVSGTPSDY